jgi:hypothetical protein
MSGEIGSVAIQNEHNLFGDPQGPFSGLLGSRAIPIQTK